MELDRAVITFEWRFDRLADGTRLTQHIVLKGEKAAAFASQVAAAFGSGLAAGMNKIVSAMERAEDSGTPMLQALQIAVETGGLE
jgi:hypothetical protein